MTTNTIIHHIFWFVKSAFSNPPLNPGEGFVVLFKPEGPSPDENRTIAGAIRNLRKDMVGRLLRRVVQSALNRGRTPPCFITFHPRGQATWPLPADRAESAAAVRLP
jgi:hypothetical protein